MENSSQNHSSSPDIPTSTTEVARVLLVGASVGLLVALLTELVSRFFIEPVFCRSADSFAICANGGTIAYNATLVIVSMIAVGALVKLNVFRPLLVALGAAASLWGMNRYIGGLPVLEYGFWMVLLFALAYLLFFWLMRARNFVVSLVALIAVVIAIRLVLAL